MVLSFLIVKTTMPSLSKHNRKWLLAAFLTKVVFGCIYGYFHEKFIPLADTWNYHFNGLKLNQTHWEHFLDHNPSSNPDNISIQAVLDFYRFEFMDAVSAIFSLITGGRYYVNVILYNFITFFGILRLYQFLLNLNPEYKKAYFVMLFFFPPFVFWTSGIHKDGICMALLGVFLYQFDILLKNYSAKSIIYSLIAICGLVFIKSYWGFAAIIGAGIWAISWRIKKISPKTIFAIGFILFILVFALTAYFPPSMNFAQSIINKQQKFIGLGGGSQIPITKLSLNFGVYMQACLDALNHLFLRPYVSEISGSPLYLATFLENVFVGILIILALYFSFIKKSGLRPLQKQQNNVLLFLVLVNYLIIGLTVPILGAIVRYKAPFEMLLILVLVQFIPVRIWNRLLLIKL